MIRVTDEQVEAFVAAATRDGGFDHGGLVITPEADADEEAAGTVIVQEPGADDPEVVSVDALAAVAQDHPANVTDWYYWTRTVDGSAAHRAFLQWVEGADDPAVEAPGHDEIADRYEGLSTGDGTTRVWGQLRIATRLRPNGERRYAVRHVDDADRAATELDTVAGPLAMRSITERDADGRYRPLSTAPTLRPGWRLPDLDHRDLPRAVDVVYPATIANWHREREGDLDVSHFRETAERQTGIYDVVDELPREAVEWAAEACCVDSQCLKRREWDEAADDPLDVPRGDGEFPCREPCSLLIAAARKWTSLEREEERSYEFELTPSEKEQLETILDAVAEGRIDAIREADLKDGANRYRARYLQAKRVKNGDLCGVPTDPEE